VYVVTVDARAACATAPSATHVCVSFDEEVEVYMVDTGGGPVRQGALAMTIDATYTFEIDPADQGDVSSHPFYLSSSAVGLGLGPLTAAITAGTLTFTPTAATPASSYYQCTVHSMMGGPITVPGGGPSPPPPDAGPSDGGHHDAGADAGPDASSSGGPSGEADGGPPAAGPGNTTAPEGEGGCGIRTAPGAPAAGIGLVALAIAGAIARRRRR
jgi:MYXO-CTERM domain-containing protein